MYFITTTYLQKKNSIFAHKIPTQICLMTKFTEVA